MATDFPLKPSHPALTDRLAASCQGFGVVDSSEKCPLPNYPALIGIAKDLKQILFPASRERRSPAHGDAPGSVGRLLASVHESLSEQISLALRCGGERSDLDARAREQAVAFLETLPCLRRQIDLDAQAALDGDPAAGGIDEVLLCYPGLEAVTVYRLAHELFALEVPLLPRMLTEWAHATTGIDIHPGAVIGSSFFIDHGTGVVIGATCEIADNVKLYQGVTLGALSFPKDDAGQIIRGRKRHPTIEENVVIYANATILGGSTVIGAGSVIGASVSLTHSVPPNTVVTIDKPSLRFRKAS